MYTDAFLPKEYHGFANALPALGQQIADHGHQRIFQHPQRYQHLFKTFQQYLFFARPLVFQ